MHHNARQLWAAYLTGLGLCGRLGLGSACGLAKEIGGAEGNAMVGLGRRVGAAEVAPR